MAMSPQVIVDCAQVIIAERYKESLTLLSDAVSRFSGKHSLDGINLEGGAASSIQGVHFPTFEAPRAHAFSSKVGLQDIFSERLLF